MHTPGFSQQQGLQAPQRPRPCTALHCSPLGPQCGSISPTAGALPSTSEPPHPPVCTPHLPPPPRGVLRLGGLVTAALLGDGDGLVPAAYLGRGCSHDGTPQTAVGGPHWPPFSPSQGPGAAHPAPPLTSRKRGNPSNPALTPLLHPELQPSTSLLRPEPARPPPGALRSAAVTSQTATGKEGWRELRGHV